MNSLIIADSIVWFYANIAMFLAILALFMILISEKRREAKLHQKALKAMEDKGYVLDLAQYGKSEEKHLVIKIIDEIFFFVGLCITIIGLILFHVTMVLVGILIMLASILTLRMWMKKQHIEEKPKKPGKKVETQAKVEVYTARADDEIKSILLIVDNLLEKLPKEEIERFANSKDFEKYKKVMRKVKDGLV